MKRYRLSYFLLQSVKGLWRNGIMSIASITVLMSCLVVMGSFALLIFNINTNLENLGLLNQIVVFIDENKTDEEALAIFEQIKALDNVDNSEDKTYFVHRDDALAEEKEKYTDYPDLFASLEGDNPLRHSVVVTYIDNAKVADLDYEIGRIDGIANKNNRLDLALSIEDVKNSISLVLVWFMVILFAVSIFVIINTIKLAVHARREEISIMRYIGATEWFVMLPFIFEGIIIGIISSVLAFFAQWYAYSYVVSMMGENLAFVEIIPFKTVFALVALAFLGIGVLTGIVGSTISTRKHLKA